VIPQEIYQSARASVLSQSLLDVAPLRS